MSVKELMDLEHLMTVVIAEKELTESSNLDLLTIRGYQKDKRQLIDLMEVSSVLAVSNRKSLEHSCWKK